MNTEYRLYTSLPLDIGFFLEVNNNLQEVRSNRQICIPENYLSSEYSICHNLQKMVNETYEELRMNSYSSIRCIFSLGFVIIFIIKAEMNNVRIIEDFEISELEKIAI